MTAHAADGVIGSDVYGRFDWFQVETVYDIKGETLVDMHRAYGAVPTRPVLSIEGLYEQERNPALRLGDPYLRWQSWTAFMAGAVGHVFGNNPRWHFDYSSAPYGYEGDWRASLDDPEGVLNRGTRYFGLD